MIFDKSSFTFLNTFFVISDTLLRVENLLSKKFSENENDCIFELRRP